MEISIKVGGWGWYQTKFPLFLFIFVVGKNMDLKHYILPKYQFKSNENGIVQLGPTLNTKLALNHHHPPPGTFQRVLGIVGG